MNLPAQYKFDDDARKRFLAFYEQHGLLYQAALAAGVCAQTVKNHLKDDEAFSAQFDEVKGRFRDRVEEEIHRRAIEGYDEYVTCGKGVVMDPNVPEGQPARILTQRRFSDRLLEFHAKRHIPEYRDKSTVDVNVTGGVLLIPAGMSAEEWKLKHGNNQGRQPAIDVTPAKPVAQQLPATKTPVR